MDQKEQGEKFDRRYGMGVTGRLEVKHGWEGCMANNTFKSKKPIEKNGALAWVIEMMRTGKTVRCKVKNKNTSIWCYREIVGYRLSQERAYIDSDSITWEYAEPVLRGLCFDGTYVYVANSEKNKVSIIDTSTMIDKPWTDL